MVSVTYQVVFNKDLDFNEKLFTLLQESFKENYDEADIGASEDYIFVKYNQKLEKEKIVVGFEVSFDEMGEGIEKVIDALNEKLNDDEDIAVAVKFYDTNLFNTFKELHEELFKIEMRLREVFTFIFIYRYKEEFHNLLREVPGLEFKFDDKREIKGVFYKKDELKKHEDKRIEYFSQFLENEFFYLLFDKYKQLSDVKQLQQNDLLEIAKTSDDFAQFKEHIINRGIVEEEHKTFLEEIGVYLENIDKIRNSVAHNRTPSLMELKDYNLAVEQINKRIDEFMTELKPEE